MKPASSAIFTSPPRRTPATSVAFRTSPHTHTDADIIFSEQARPLRFLDAAAGRFNDAMIG
jgi:hypothetical protein